MAEEIILNQIFDEFENEPHNLSMFYYQGLRSFLKFSIEYKNIVHFISMCPLRPDKKFTIGSDVDIEDIGLPFLDLNYRIGEIILDEDSFRINMKEPFTIKSKKIESPFYSTEWKDCYEQITFLKNDNSFQCNYHLSNNKKVLLEFSKDNFHYFFILNVICGDTIYFIDQNNCLKVSLDGKNNSNICSIKIENFEQGCPENHYLYYLEHKETKKILTPFSYINLSEG